MDISKIRKRYVRQEVINEGDFKVRPEMIGRRVSELRRINPQGRGRPYGLLGYIVTDNTIRFAYSLTHPNDVFCKKTAHIKVDGRIQSELDSFEYELNSAIGIMDLKSEHELPDAIRYLALEVYNLESDRLERKAAKV